MAEELTVTAAAEEENELTPEHDTEGYLEEGEKYEIQTEVSDSEADEKTENSENTPAYKDYEKMAKDDLLELEEKFPETRGLGSITRLPSPIRYAELRDLGLTASEAYLASGRIKPKSDNRSHLHSAVPKGAGTGGGGLSPLEMRSAREIFSGLSDAEIQRLYKKVTFT